MRGKELVTGIKINTCRVFLKFETLTLRNLQNNTFSNLDLFDIIFSKATVKTGFVRFMIEIFKEKYEDSLGPMGEIVVSVQCQIGA